jgi:hypothetical protein
MRLLLVPVFDPTACISVVDDVTQILVISIMHSVALLQWSETVGRVPVWTLPVVRLITLDSVVAVENQVHHGCCIQHRVEALYRRVDFFIVFRQVGCELVDEHS